MRDSCYVGNVIVGGECLCTCERKPLWISWCCLEGCIMNVHWRQEFKKKNKTKINYTSSVFYQSKQGTALQMATCVC